MATVSCPYWHCASLTQPTLSDIRPFPLVSFCPMLTVGNKFSLSNQQRFLTALILALLFSIALHTIIWSIWGNAKPSPKPENKPLILEASIQSLPAQPAPIPAPPVIRPKPTPAKLASNQAKATKPGKPKLARNPSPKIPPVTPPSPAPLSKLAVDPSLSTPTTANPVTALNTTKPQPVPATIPESLVKAAYAGPGLHNPATRYPRIALQRGLEGTVKLEVRVLADGSAGEVKVVESSGHEILDESAIEQIRSWHFIPARRGNQPVDDWVRVPISFKFQH